MMNLDSI